MLNIWKKREASHPQSTASPTGMCKDKFMGGDKFRGPFSNLSSTPPPTLVMGEVNVPIIKETL